MDVARSVPRGAVYHAIGIYLLGIEKGSKELTVLLVRPTPTQVPTNILYTPVNNATLHFIPGMWHLCDGSNRGRPLGTKE